MCKWKMSAIAWTVSKMKILWCEMRGGMKKLNKKANDMVGICIWEQSEIAESVIKDYPIMRGSHVKGK